jgi:acyl carrier protein
MAYRVIPRIAASLDGRNMNSIKQNIHTYILNEFLQGESPANLRDDTPLKTSGILDSLATLNLVSYLEKEFGITIEAHETGVENFDRLCDIAALVARKRQMAG